MHQDVAIKSYTLPHEQWICMLFERCVPHKYPLVGLTVVDAVAWKERPVVLCCPWDNVIKVACRAQLRLIRWSGQGGTSSGLRLP